MEDARGELEHLEHGEVLLEGVAEAEGGPEVVEVHEGVDEGVDPGAVEGGTVAVAKVEEHAPDEADGEVVVHVEEGELLLLLAEHHEDRVEHVKELGEEVREDPELDVGVELTADVEDVVHEVGGKGDGHGDGGDHLNDVVEHHGTGDVEGLTVLHDEAEKANQHEVAEVAANDDLEGHQMVELGVEAQGFLLARHFYRTSMVGGREQLIYGVNIACIEHTVTLETNNTTAEEELQSTIGACTLAPTPPSATARELWRRVRSCPAS